MDGSAGPSLEDVLRSAARLQEVAPEAVLVGGAAAAFWAGHRASFGHDHVLPDLQDRYMEVLEAVEATDGWVTSVRASAPPVTLLGRLGGIEAGLRQLRRRRPLEVVTVRVADTELRVPTDAEILRIKAYLVLQRNQVRDYLDVVALADRMGEPTAAQVLVSVDDYYADRSDMGDGVLTGVVQRLSDPNPRDARVTHQLASYRRLDPRWHEWSAVVTACHALADALLDLVEDRAP